MFLDDMYCLLTDDPVPSLTQYSDPQFHKSPKNSQVSRAIERRRA
jgi:hypothetical protein